MWKSFALSLRELFFPERCCFCGKYGVPLCGDCVSLLDIFLAHRPDREKKYLSDIYAACSYENKYVQRLIRDFKYEPLRRGLGIPLAKLVAGHFTLAGPPLNPADSVIVAVPLAKKRWRWRGFNQSAIIAEQLGLAWQMPVIDCLRRIRETKNQAELTGAARQENIKGAFACSDGSLLKNKLVFLIDDVVTTGATMNECARVLLKNGGGQVIGVAIARTEKS